MQRQLLSRQGAVDLLPGAARGAQAGGSGGGASERQAGPQVGLWS